MVFCKECKKQITDNNFYFHDPSGGRFCSKVCLDKFILKEKEKDDKNHLWGTICRIFHVIKVPPRILGEIKRFRTKENLSYKQIDAIVHYLYDIKHEMPYGETIYKVPDFKEEAQAWYLKNNSHHEVIQEKPKTRIVVPNYIQKKNIMEINPEDV